MAIVASQLQAVISVTGADKAKADLAGMGQAVNTTGGFLKTGLIGLGIAAGAALIGIGVSATKMAADYQQQMNKVQALTGASNDQMTFFDKSVKQLAMDTGTAPKQLADGLYNVVSAGYQGKDAMTLLALATKDAKIGMTDSATTTKSLTALLAQFGLQAQDATRVNGEMLETVTLGSGTFEQYSSNIVKSASSASQFGVSLETMNAAYATLTSSQIKSAQASTDFQQSLKVMYGNIGTVTKSLEKNGIAFDEAKFNASNYGDKVKMLDSALEEANAKHVKITGVTLQAAQAIHTISQHMDVYNKDLKTLSDRQAMAQKTQEAWATTVGGFNVSWDRFKATISVGMIDLGQKLLPIATFGVNALNNAMQAIGPVVQDVAQYFSKFDLTSISHAWGQLTSAVKDALKPLGNAGDAFKSMTPFLTEMRNDFSQLLVGGIRDVGGIIQGITNAIQGLGKGDSGSALRTLGESFKTLAGALGGELGKELKTAGGDLQQFGSWFSTSVVPAIKDALPGFLNLANTLLNTVGPAFVQIRGIVFDVVEHAFKTFGPIIAQVVPPLIRFAGILANDIANGLKFIMPYILQATQAIGKFADEIMTRVAPIINNWITGLTPLVQAFMNGWFHAWPMIAGVLKGVWDEIVGIIKIAWAIVSGVIKIGLDVMGGNWKQAWTDFKDMLKGIWDGIKQTLKGAIEALVAEFKPLLEAMSHLPGPAGDMARNVLKSFDDMKDGSADATNQMKLKNVQNIIDMQKQAIASIDNMRQQLIQKIKDTSDPVQKHMLEMQLGSTTQMENLRKNALDKAQDMKDKLVGHSIIPDMVNSIVSWFASLPQGALNALASLPGKLSSFWSGIVTDATNAGSNIVKGIANGINGAIQGVKDAIGNVANWISAHLPHSPAKVGPLVDLPKQGAMITEQIGQGMLSNLPRLTTALAQLVKPISMTLSPQGALPAGTTGIPSISLPAQSSAGQPQPLIINIDGQRVARVLLPAIVSQIRYNVGAWAQ